MTDPPLQIDPVTTNDRPPGPEEIKLSFIVPKALLARFSVSLFADALTEAPAHGRQTVRVWVRDLQVFILHAEDRAPLSEDVSSEVMVVASTSTSSRYLAVRWDERQSLGVTVRGA